MNIFYCTCEIRICYITTIAADKFLFSFVSYSDFLYFCAATCVLPINKYYQSTKHIMIETGLNYKATQIVTEAMTAKSVGSGDLPVLATPMMIALMENAAMLAVAGHLRENETTVGGFIECSHLKPTAIGEEIEAFASLRKIDGAALHFEIEAFADGKKIGTARHIRYIVDRRRFLAKLSRLDRSE